MCCLCSLRSAFCHQSAWPGNRGVPVSQARADNFVRSRWRRQFPADASCFRCMGMEPCFHPGVKACLHKPVYIQHYEKIVYCPRAGTGPAWAVVPGCYSTPIVREGSSYHIPRGMSSCCEGCILAPPSGSAFTPVVITVYLSDCVDRNLV